MFLVLLISKPFVEALRVVKEVSVPMIITSNGIGVGIFALIITNLIREKRTGFERDRYYAELERKIYEMGKLYRLGVKVSSTLDIKAVLDLCISTTVDVLEAEAGFLFMIDDKSGRLFLGSMAISENSSLSLTNSSPESNIKIIKGKRVWLEKEKSVAGWVIKNRKPFLTNNVDNQEISANPVYKDFNFKVNSILCVPLLIKDKVIGVIQVCNKRKYTDFTDEDQHLLVSFAVHAAIAIENARLYQEVAERERMKRELEIAHKLQTSLLPDKSPQVEGYQIAAMSRPAREVGGDFYDFIDVAENKIGLIIGDVAGKGLPAALFMALSRSFLRAQAIGNLKTNTVMEKTNRLITKDAKEGIFVSAIYAILDTSSKVLRFSSAGHNPPILFRSATNNCEVLKTKDIVLGVLDEVKFQEKELFLKRGDIVIFYTDGVIEAIDENGRQFGMDRLITILKDNFYLQASELVNIIEEKIKEFVKNQPQFDDLTIMVVKMVY